MRYGTRFGCRGGMPHDFGVLHETKAVKWEVCHRCGLKKRFNKGYRGRVHNNEYLKAHVRNFAQRFGATKRIYHKLYKPDKCVIKI